jgi:hypothetical protein
MFEFFLYNSRPAYCVDPLSCEISMDEGRERDNTSRVGGPPTLPGLYLSTFQPSQRGFF